MSRMNRNRISRGARWLTLAIGLLALAALVAAPPFSVADDGSMVRKEVSKTPDLESEKAQLSMMQFYVPATRANGELTVIEYFADLDGDNQPDGDTPVELRDMAKPLVVSYYDEVAPGTYRTGGAASSVWAASGVELGPEVRRDAWTAFSLDDGETWKEENLSESALETSFTLANGLEFPGDVPEVVHAVAGNRILVAWTSKYCDSGSPRYSLKDDLDADGDGDVEEPLYEDLFDVAGNQGSIDYTEWMHHGEYPFAYVGEIPFSCVWTARGSLEQVTNPQTGTTQWGVRWRKAERLTSGKRDAFYLAIDGVEGAGFALAWQEDPEGLRPGYGEGPGIGWSGATVNHKTDIWYSTISWADFAPVDTTDQQPDTNKPKVAERMTMPLVVSDNYNCLSDRVDSDGNPHPGFCFADFNGNGTADLCADTYPWVNSKGELKNICVTEDGRLLNGQTGSSRTRMSLEGYTNAAGEKSAWVVMAYEETKGLGAGHGDLEPLDIGKDVMYHSFDMFQPEMAAPGTMLNMPETLPGSDPDNPTLLAPMVNDKGELQYPSAIGRRPSLIVQPASKIRRGVTSAAILYKDGTERQGGPSDIFLRRFVVPAGFNPATDNPYAVENLQCDVADTAIVASSPSAYPASAYPNGLCLFGAINVSGTTPLTLEPLDNSSDGELPSHGITERVGTWVQTPENLDDESWVNHFEVAKGHRGFLDGNFLMVMYAHSANWLATSHGHEPYNLYIRRSFDGGLTWTTTPASLGGDGTFYTQVFGVGDRVWMEYRDLAAGEFEPARNVSQITTSKETVLDPRYSPTNIGTESDVNRVLLADGTYQYTQPYPEDDVRDPSKFFAVYETGDATTIEEGGEADPLDLFFSRATNWGDDWDSLDAFAQGRGEWEERWDWLENKKDVLSGEASLGASPGGAFLWAVWNQWEEDADGHVSESDPIFRRLWWNDDETLVATLGTWEAASGEVVLLSALVDYTGDLATLSYLWDLDTDGIFETAETTPSFPASGAPQAVAVKVCAPSGACDVSQGWVNRPDPHTPRVWRIRPAVEAVKVGTMLEVTGKFNLPGQAEIASIDWDWGDGSPLEPGTLPADLQGEGAAFVTGSHAYAAAGVYPVKLVVTDDAGRVGYDFEYVAVVDPAAGAITGEASFVAAEGTVAFQFDAKYDKNKGTLKGQATFDVGGGELVFASNSVAWLVVEADGMSHLVGDGTLNGQGGYRFLLTIQDGGKKGADLGRVRFWHTGAGKNGHLVYDSQLGAPLGADATAVLQGNVTLHVK